MKVEREIVVVNKLGLHARAAAKLVKLCSGCDCSIQLAKGSQMIDAKSIMGVLMLAASQGTTLQLVVEGEDAEAVADDISSMFQNCFDEGE